MDIWRDGWMDGAEGVDGVDGVDGIDGVDSGLVSR